MSKRRMRRWIGVTRAAGLLTGLLALAGCASDPTVGWSAVTTYDDAYESIAVPIARNDTFSKGLEFELTDALIKEIGARTPYTLASQTRSDTVLITHIREVELTQLSKNRLSGLGEEMLVGVTIDFEWRDQRRQAFIVERRSFTGHGLFVPASPTGERIELGRMAVVQQLARDVVTELRGAW